MNLNVQSAFSLKGKNVIITGASSGIGKACAIACSEAGANVFLIARDKNRLEETLRSLSEGNHTYLSFDLSNVNEISSIISDYTKNYGPLYGLIHSAGIENTIPLQFCNAETYIEMFKINVVAGFELAKCLSKKTNCDISIGASYIFISSVMGTLGQEGKTAYSSSKGALISGAKSMAIELARKSIRVNTISPAIVETEMTKKMFETLPQESYNKIKEMHPLGFGCPEDVAFASVYLLSDASRWVTGTNLIIDGGYSAK